MNIHMNMNNDCFSHIMSFLRPEEAARLGLADREALAMTRPHLPRVWAHNDAVLYAGTVVVLEREAWRPTPRRLAVVLPDLQHARFITAGGMRVRVRLPKNPPPRRCRHAHAALFFVCK